MTSTHPIRTDSEAATTDEKMGAAQDPPALCWLNLAGLAPHPDNPRTRVGDLSELARSIRSHGIIEPLVVLPANDDGIYLIVAGRRRHAAAIKAGLADVPAVVRPMTQVEVIEAGLSENGNRSDLTLSEEIRAIEHLMVLDAGVTPTKLCRRIGRSQGWVRARMAVSILPSRWRDQLDSGGLTLAAAEAAASVADLGPEHLDAVCERLSGRSWQEPTRVVAAYREELRRADAYAKTVEQARAKHAVVFTAEDPAPERARRVDELFDAAGRKAHATEPCHAITVRSTGWGDGVERFDICTDPRRHAPRRVGTTGNSTLATSRSTNAGRGDDAAAKRKARTGRLAHACETFARPRGGLGQNDLTRLALRALVNEAGRDALTFAATILGRDDARTVTARQLLDDTPTNAALTRVAGAVAMGLAETRMYWSGDSPPCRDYLAALTGTGWTPDEWTAAILERAAARDAWPATTDDTAANGEDQVGDVVEDEPEDVPEDEPEDEPENDDDLGDQVREGVEEEVEDDDVPD
jgi:ParB/RepB/Spo0J family partition protein